MSDTTALLLVCGALLVWWASSQDEDDSDQIEAEAPGIIDKVETKIDELTASAGPVEGMRASAQLLDMLKRTETLVLHRYPDANGYSWGYGHFSMNPNELPYNITREQAESLFADDVAQRAEKWVKLYVKIDLTQYEFDALVSIAFNMSPPSFKKFAADVNEGYNIDTIAADSVGWVKPQYTNAIARRRAAEVALFNYGTYA